MVSLIKAKHQCIINKRFISYNANKLLSKENREICMRKFQGMLIKQGSKPIVRQAAVLIPIYVKGNKVSLLYTRRAANLRTHRGQISFPGGMEEESDSSLEQTVLRETNEELGIDPKDIEVWGKGNPIIRQDMAIIPFVGCLKYDLPLDKLQINVSEVENLFTIQIEKLINLETHSHTQFRGTYCTPTYLGSPYRIWGLTAVMTYMFLKSLISPKHYTYRINYIPDVLKILTRERNVQQNR